jgi:hypothetical protein
MIGTYWYAKPDDLIGGWCVMRSDMTPQEFSLWIVDQKKLNPNMSHDEWLQLHREHGQVACFVDDDDAREIAALHNEEVARMQDLLDE